MALHMDPQEQIKELREAKMLAEKAKMKSAQGKRLVPFLMKQKFHLSDMKFVTSEAETLDQADIESVNAKIEEMENDLDSEIKAQKLADSDAKIGWKLVKEYEGIDLAENEDDAKAIRSAMHRAKRGNAGSSKWPKRGRGGNRFGGFGNPMMSYGMGGGGQMGFANMTMGGPPQMYYQNRMAGAPQMMPQFPAGQYGGGQAAAQPRSAPNMRSCFKCGMPGHLKDFCPNSGPPRV